MNEVCLNKYCYFMFHMNRIRFRNRWCGFRIEINETDRVQFETIKLVYRTFAH